MSTLKKAGGIFYGWWIVIVSAIMFMFIGGISVYGFSAFFDPIILDMGWTRAETSLAFSLRSVESGITAPFIGFLIDKLGARRCIFAGVIIIGVSFLLMSRVDNVIMFYVSFLLLALGTSAGVSNAQYAAVANWFKRRRALALGIVASGFGLCGIMSPFLVYLIDNQGWRMALVILGPAILVLGIPLSLLIRHRPEPYGLRPDGDKDPLVVDPKVQDKAVTSVNDGLTWQQCVTTRTFWLMTLFSFFTGFSQSAINVLNISHLVNVGVSRDLAGWAVTGITASSLIGRLGFAWLGDRFSKKKLVILAAVMQTAGVFVFAGISSPWMLIPFLLLYGPGFGAPIPLMQAIQAECFGTRSFASLRGLLSVGWTIPGLIAPYLAGWLCDLQGDYRLAFYIYAAICIFSVPTVMLMNLRTGTTHATTLETTVH
jgi:MFS family permease